MPPITSIRARLRAWTIRLNKKKRTKKAQGLKASSPASTSVKTGSDTAAGSSSPKSGTRMPSGNGGADSAEPPSLKGPAT